MNEGKLFGYIRGEASEQQRQIIERWYGLNPKNAELLELLYETHTLQKSVETLEQTDVDMALRNFKKRVKKKEGGMLGISRLRLIRYAKRVAVAAVFTLAVVFSSIWAVEFVGRVQRPMIVRTNVGERVQIELPDGSMVWLNACSEIKYGPSLFGSQRRVEMSGEAYFDVAKDKESQFVVKCNGMDIKVLGTKFNVRANDDEEILTTTLLEGSVLVESPLFHNKKGITMKPDQELYINKKTGNTELIATNQASANIDWVDGKLRFTGNTFDEIAKSLQRNYNVDIIFKDEIIRHKVFTCDFATSDNIYRILSIMELTGKFKYEIKGRQVEISSR